jgi:hypothetical protein
MEQIENQADQYIQGQLIFDKGVRGNLMDKV